MERKWYKLGGSSTCFWDPKQSDRDNADLIVGQAKQFDETDRVAGARSGGHIVEVPEAEAIKLNEAFAKSNAKVDTTAKDTKSNAKADATLEKAAILEQKGNEALALAETKFEAANSLIADNDKLKSELAETKAKLDAASKK